MYLRLEESEEAYSWGSAKYRQEKELDDGIGMNSERSILSDCLWELTVLGYVLDLSDILILRSLDGADLTNQFCLKKKRVLGMLRLTLYFYRAERQIWQFIFSSFCPFFLCFLVNIISWENVTLKFWQIYGTFIWIYLRTWLLEEQKDQSKSITWMKHEYTVHIK